MMPTQTIFQLGRRAATALALASTLLTLDHKVSAAAPEIVSFPDNASTAIGEPLELCVHVAEEGHYTYEWYKNGHLIPGANDSVYHVAQAKVTDGGTYRAKVRNDDGSVLSEQATVLVAGRAHGQFCVAEGKALTLTAPAAGGVGLSYQWFMSDGSPVEESEHVKGVNTSKLRFLCASTSDACEYFVRISSYDLVSLDRGNYQVKVIFTPVMHELHLGPWDVAREVTDQVCAEKEPTHFRIKGLPPGLCYDSSTGQLHGRPTKPGTYHLRVAACNKAGWSEEVYGTVEVRGLQEGIHCVYGANIVRSEANHHLGGQIRFEILPTGCGTGKVTIDGCTVAFKFHLTLTEESNYNFETTVKVRHSQHESIYIAANVDGANGEANGVVTTACGESDFTAHIETCLPEHALGYYTAALNPSGLGNEQPQCYPVGYGYVTLSVKKDHSKPRVIGRLADGTVFTAVGMLVEENRIIFHSPLYYNCGSTQGDLKFYVDEHPIGLYGKTDWIKLASSKHKRNYAHGIPLHSMDTVGARYQVQKGVNVMDYYQTTGNAELLFNSAGIEHSSAFHDTARQFTLTKTNSAILLKPNPTSAKLTIIGKTGVYYGSFHLDDENACRTVKFFGILQPNSGYGVGSMLLPQLVDPEAHPAQSEDTTPIWSGQSIIREFSF
jgi:hypothetical protein